MDEPEQNDQILDLEREREELLSRHHELIQAQTQKADLLAIGTLNSLMTVGDERVQLQAATEWLSHRRKIQEAVLKLEQAKQDSSRPHLHFDANSLARETDNVRSIKQAFSIPISSSARDRE